VIEMVRVYYDKDVTTNYLKDKTVAVIGYGSQGKAQSLNLRDSGINVILGLEEEWRKLDSSYKLAEDEGFKIYSVAEATKRADIIHILIPDMAQPPIYQNEIQPNLSAGKALGFSHGFNIHFKYMVPQKDVDVIMVAPKSPGPRLRELYTENFGPPALLSVYQNYSGKGESLVLEMAKAIGCTRAGALWTTFKDETESDLIGEQTVLVGGLMELITTGFEILVEEGYPPELAYFEACNEAKLIIDLIYEGGMPKMLFGCSETARYGGLAVGPTVIDEHVKENMRKAAKAVKDGSFAKRWVEEYKAGRKNLNALTEKAKNHQLEKVGSTMRKMAGIEK